MNIKSKKILAQLLSVAVVGSTFAVPVAGMSTPVINVNAEETEQTVKNIDFKSSFTSDNMEYAVVTAYNEFGDTVWTYETKEYSVGQLSMVEELGEHNNVYYIIEGGTIVALDYETGEILWQNNNFSNASIAFAFGENAIYVCEYYGSDFYAISYEGETLKRISNLNEIYTDSEYYWVDNIEIIDNKYAVVHFAVNDEILYVDLQTYEVFDSIETSTTTTETTTTTTTAPHVTATAIITNTAPPQTTTTVITTAQPETTQPVKDVDFKSSITSDNMEYAVVTAYNESGVAWTYKTKEYPVGQLDRVYKLGEHNDVYYLAEGGTIVSLDLETGEVLWQNGDFNADGIAFAFGEEAIYISAYLVPDFYAISYEGETLKRISHLDDDYSDSGYYWADNVEIIDNKYVAVHFEANDGILYVDLETYEVLDNIETGETTTETTTEPAITYEWYVEPSIEADDINSVGVFMQSIPNGSYDDDYEYTYGQFIDTGYAVIKDGDFYGVIDMGGNIVIEPDYVLIRGAINEHFRLYDEDGKYSYFCCETGEYLDPQEPHCAWCDKTLLSDVSSSYYCYDPEKDLLAYIGTMPGNDSEEVVSLDSQNGSGKTIDFPEGKVIPVRLVSIDGDEVTLSDEYTIMKDGEFVTGFVYDNVLSYKNGVTAVEIDEEWYYFDEEGNQIIEAPCDASYSFGNADVPYLPSEDCIAFNTLWGGGYYATDGEVVIPVGEFAEVRPVFNGLAWVKDHETGLWGVIQLTGERAGTPDNDNGDSDSDDGNGGSSSGNSSSSSGSTGKASPKTGDNSGKVFALLALSAGVMVVSKKRKDK